MRVQLIFESLGILVNNFIHLTSFFSGEKFQIESCSLKIRIIYCKKNKCYLTQDSYLKRLYFLRDLRNRYTSLEISKAHRTPAIMYTAITVLSRGMKHFDQANLSGVMMLCKGKEKQELMTLLIITSQFQFEHKTTATTETVTDYFKLIIFHCEVPKKIVIHSLEKSL